MSTVIYLANQQIQIVEGTKGKKNISVKRYYTTEAPEGSLINGIVMDVESFVPFLQETWASQRFPEKDVILVIESTKFMGRNMEIPVLGEKKTYEYIDREYADVGREDDTRMVYSYITHGRGEGKNIRIYAESAEPDFISDYIEIFSHAGIKLSAIYSGKSALITFVAQEAAKKFNTFVLIVADVMTFSTVLWVNGAFSYYNSTRCFQVPGTPLYAMDLANSVSQLHQFMQANKIEHELESIQIAGVHPDDRQMYAESIQNMGINTPIDVFSVNMGGKVDWSLQNYLHPVGGLYDGGKTENMLTAYSALKKREKAINLPGRRYIISIGSLFLVMLLLVVSLFIVRLGRQRELNALNDYNSSPEVMFSVSEYDMYSERNSYLQSQYDAIADVEENLGTYPVGDTDVLKVFDRCAVGYAQVKYEAFDAENGTIRIEAKSENVDNINKFIKKLMQEKTFSHVDYTGYALGSEDGLWDIHVTCTLAERAGRKQ